MFVNNDDLLGALALCALPGMALRRIERTGARGDETVTVFCQEPGGVGVFVTFYGAEVTVQPNEVPNV